MVFKEPGLSFKYLHGDSQPPENPVLGDPIIYSGLCRHQACSGTHVHMHTCKQNTHKQVNFFLKKLYMFMYTVN